MKADIHGQALVPVCVCEPRLCLIIDLFMPIFLLRKSRKAPKLNNCVLLWGFDNFESLSVVRAEWNSTTHTHTHWTHTQGPLLFAVMMCRRPPSRGGSRSAEGPTTEAFLLLYCFLPKKRSTKDCRSPLPDLSPAPLLADPPPAGKNKPAVGRSPPSPPFWRLAPE